MKAISYKEFKKRGSYDCDWSSREDYVTYCENLKEFPRACDDTKKEYICPYCGDVTDAEYYLWDYFGEYFSMDGTEHHETEISCGCCDSEFKLKWDWIDEKLHTSMMDCETENRKHFFKKDGEPSKTHKYKEFAEQSVTYKCEYCGETKEVPIAADGTEYSKRHAKKMYKQCYRKNGYFYHHVRKVNLNTFPCRLYRNDGDSLNIWTDDGKGTKTIMEALKDICLDRGWELEEANWDRIITDIHCITEYKMTRKGKTLRLDMQSSGLWIKSNDAKTISIMEHRAKKILPNFEVVTASYRMTKKDNGKEYIEESKNYEELSDYSKKDYTTPEGELINSGTQVYFLREGRLGRATAYRRRTWYTIALLNAKEESINLVRGEDCSYELPPFAKKFKRGRVRGINRHYSEAQKLSRLKEVLDKYIDKRDFLRCHKIQKEIEKLEGYKEYNYYVMTSRHNSFNGEHFAMFWGSNRGGYSDDLRYAGKYSRDQALDLHDPESGEYMIEASLLGSLFNSSNKCKAMIEKATVNDILRKNGLDEFYYKGDR